MKCLRVVLANLLLLSLPPGEAIRAADPCVDMPAEHAVRKIRQYDAAHTVAASETFKRIKEGARMAFIDVRGAGEFEQFRIPGSINIPLHFVKTKIYLKTKPFILFDHGYRQEVLAEECRRLVEGGFPCSIMYGGLTAWRDAGGPLEGDHAAWKRLGIMTAAAYFQEKDLEGWLTIDVSERGTSLSACLMPGAISVPFAEDPLRFVSKLKLAVRPQQSHRFGRTLVFNENGGGYDSIQFLAAKTGMKNLFLLEGGLDQYARYLRRRALSAVPRQERLKTTDGCGSACEERR